MRREKRLAFSPNTGCVASAVYRARLAAFLLSCKATSRSGGS
jgi:hypothetical protein